MLGLEGGQRLLEHLPVEHLFLGVRCRACVAVEQLDLDHPTPSAPRSLDRGVHGDAMDLGVPALGIAQARQVSPSLDHRLLDGIPREIRVPEDESGDRVEARESLAGKQREGVMIAVACCEDQCSLFHGRPPGWSSSCV